MAAAPSELPQEARAGQEQKSDLAKSTDGTGSRIGWAFLSQYYSFLNKDPSRLHCFYTKRSTLIHSTEGEEVMPCYGQQEIHSKIMSLGFEDCKVYISNVDSQSSAEGGIIVQVIGEMSNRGGQWRKFAQTFFLAEQPNGYFVLNDICRYIKEEGDEEEAAATPAQVESVVTDDSFDLPEPSYPSLTTFAPLSDNGDVPAEPTPVFEEPAPVDFPSFTTKEPTGPLTNGLYHEELEPPVLPSSPSPVAKEPLVLAEDVAPALPAPEPTVEAVVEPTQVEEPIVPSPLPGPIPESLPIAPPSPPPSLPTPPVVAAAPLSAPTPRSWADLAATNRTKWGTQAVDTKGVSSAAPIPVAAAHTERVASAASVSARTYPPAVNAITSASCFIKGVVETVSDKALRDVLTARFGAVRELDIIRSKACAFLEFERVDSARRAILASMRPGDGGEGGILIDTDMLHIVTRRAIGDRPVSTRGRGGGGMGPGEERSGRGGRSGTGAGGSTGGRESGAGGGYRGSVGAGSEESGSRGGRGGSKARGSGRTVTSKPAAK